MKDIIEKSFYMSAFVNNMFHIAAGQQYLGLGKLHHSNYNTAAFKLKPPITLKPQTSSVILNDVCILFQLCY